MKTLFMALIGKMDNFNELSCIIHMRLYLAVFLTMMIASIKSL